MRQAMNVLTIKEKTTFNTMHNPTTAEICQTAIGKDIGGMAQGNNKMHKKGTNSMFVMTHEEIKHVLQAGKKITYANPVVDHHPQKEIPN
jgi:hypothetical protein